MNKIPFVQWFIKKNNQAHTHGPRWSFVREGEKDSKFLLNALGVNAWPTKELTDEEIQENLSKFHNRNLKKTIDF